jgi:5-methylcytosine-specific restriction endonuclease McrA
VSNEHRTSAWTKARNIVRPRLQAEINAGNGWCYDGRHIIRPGERWDVSHVISIQNMKAAGMPETEWHRPENLTSSHVKCNRSAGGTAGAKKSNHTKAVNAGRIDEW